MVQNPKYWRTKDNWPETCDFFLFTFPSGVLSHSFAFQYFGFCTMWHPVAKGLFFNLGISTPCLTSGSRVRVGICMILAWETLFSNYYLTSKDVNRLPFTIRDICSLWAVLLFSFVRWVLWLVECPSSLARKKHTERPGPTGIYWYLSSIPS